MEDNKMDMYSKIMDDICDRTNGEWERMSYSDKLMSITIMKQVKKEVDRYMAEQYPAIKMWASLDISDIQLQEKEPDLNRLHNEDSLYKQFIN